jgi:hypothetical protein
MLKLADCYIKISNLEEAIGCLESLINLTRGIQITDSICTLRYRSRMLLAATVINMGDYTKVL